MATASVQNDNNKGGQTVLPVKQPAIKLHVTTAQIGGKEQERWSISWGK